MTTMTKARAAGFFYLLMMSFGAIVELAKKPIVVPNDAAATAANILAHRSWFQSWYAAELLVVVSYLVVTALFFELFKPVSHTISLLAAFFSLIGCATQAFTSLFRIAPLAILSGDRYLSAFSPQQLQAMAYLSFKLYGQAYGVGLVFFASYLIAIGWLIFKSTFLPRAIGALAALAGLGWLTFLYPSLAGRLFPNVLLPLAALGEGGLMLWLLVKGVNVQRWEEKAGASRG